MARWLVSHDKCLKNERDMRHASGSVARSMARQSVIVLKNELRKVYILVGRQGGSSVGTIDGYIRRRQRERQKAIG